LATVLTGTLIVLALVVALPVSVFCLEVTVAWLRPGPARWPGRARLEGETVAVLVPAHNEGEALVPTLRDIRSQLPEADRIVVVADNCTDDTAAVAARFGADVVERNDPSRRGKGYALDYGLRHLAKDPPTTVVMCDADCRLEPEMLDRLRATCVATRKPVQALYLMVAPEGSPVGRRIAELAWRVKNWLRPLGLAGLGWPCQLTGTGMAFPWELISSVNLAGDELAEDLELGLELAMRGRAPIFCPAARVTSRFASSPQGVSTQRERWEHGHLGIIVRKIPLLLWKSLSRRDWQLLTLTLDAAVPPLSLLVVQVAAVFIVSLVFRFVAGPAMPLLITIVSTLMLLLATAIAWLSCGRDLLPPSQIWSIGPYIIAKLPLYRRFIWRSGKERSWIRTDRS
jgi:glycosyltransferase involved in cell wall biosynthesis